MSEWYTKFALAKKTLLQRKYQPSGKGGIRSLPATLHQLWNRNWPPRDFNMIDGVSNGVDPSLLGALTYFFSNNFLIWATKKERKKKLEKWEGAMREIVGTDCKASRSCQNLHCLHCSASKMNTLKPNNQNIEKFKYQIFLANEINQLLSKK